MGVFVPRRASHDDPEAVFGLPPVDLLGGIRQTVWQSANWAGKPQKPSLELREQLPLADW